RLSLIRKINQIYLLTWCILVAEIGAFLFTENGALLFSDYRTTFLYFVLLPYLNRNGTFRLWRKQGYQKD
ncbi:MAG: hypothetical protein ACK40G_06900, partial [Cytophagaceae bacterium]